MWALAGAFDKTKTKTNPDALQVEKLAAELASRLQGVTSAVEAAGHIKLFMDEASMTTKQYSRLQKALGHLHEARSLPTETIDQRKLKQLIQEAAQKAPAVDALRSSAVDAGLY